jgi:hypothetical protein
MVKYWIKNRLVVDLLIAAVLSLLFSFAFVYPSNNNCLNVQNENSIYLNSDIDFQIPNPSVSQLSEIKAKTFIQDTFGYYLTKTTVKGNKSSKVNFLMSDTMGSLSMTMFNDKTSISSISKTSNYAYVDLIAADSLGINCGDELSVTIAGSTLKYIVCGIYEDNSLFSEGTVLVDFSGDIKTVYEANASSNGYAGAFINASNESECESFLRSYIPEGRLKDRSAFESDEAYNTYNEAIKSGNYANEITNFGSIRIQAKTELASAENTRTTMGLIGSIVVGIIYIISGFILRNRKSEDKYFKDVLKNKKSIGKYRVASLVAGLVVYTILTVALQFYFETLSISMIPLCIVVAFIIVGFIINTFQDKAYLKIKAKDTKNASK